jgi:hypothetical protein
MIRNLLAKPSIRAWHANPVIATGPATDLPEPFYSAGGVPIQPPHRPKKVIYSEPREAKEVYLHAYEVAEEVIFEFEGWRIENWPNSPPGDCDWVSHYCPVKKWRQRIDQWSLMADGCCPGCCELVPNEVMGVWKLKHFNTAPTEDEARQIQDPSEKIYTRSNQPEEKSTW